VLNDFFALFSGGPVRIFFKVIIICLAAYFSTVNAQSPRYYKIPYIVKGGETLSGVFRKFVRDDSIVKRSTPMIQRTLKANGQVEDWRSLKAGERLQLYVSDDFLDKKKLQAYKNEMRKKIAALKKAREKKKADTDDPESRPTGLKASAFYMASFGTFTQSGEQLADLTFEQNSPVTLGSSFSYYPESGPWSYTWSLYFSNLIAASNNINPETTDIPLEVGGNFYAEYSFKDYGFTGYGGVDFERFHTFNLPSLESNRTILLDENRVYYFTLGVADSIKIFGKSFFTKLSFSKSLASSTTTESLSEATEEFSGYKVLWYVNKKISDSFYVHTLFKYHKMSGPSELTITRIGAGLGYSFF
jgi:hypothetical protein